MNFEQALAAMREGKKVRALHWIPMQYIELKDGAIVGTCGREYDADINDLLSIPAWEIMEVTRELSWAQIQEVIRKYHNKPLYTICDARTELGFED